MFFKNRLDAGEKIAENLQRFAGKKGVVVVGLARGGMVVAGKVADVLGVDLGVVVVKKMGMPGNPELALGAVAAGGGVVVNEEIIQMLGVPRSELQREKEKQSEAAKEAESKYGSIREGAYRGRTVILVDDGIATGASMLAACMGMRGRGVAQLIVAVPVASPGAIKRVCEEADEVICLEAPQDFFAVGAYYEEFDQVSDEEVTKTLLKNRKSR